MKQTLNTSIEKINHLDRNSLEQYLITEQSLPNSDEKVFNIGYALLKLDRLDEAFSLFEKLSGNPFEKTNIFLTGYYEGCDGNWHSYDDSCHHNDNDDDDGGCCACLCTCLCLSGCCSGDTCISACNGISHCFC